MHGTNSILQNTYTQFKKAVEDHEDEIDYREGPREKERERSLRWMGIDCSL